MTTKTVTAYPSSSMDCTKDARTWGGLTEQQARAKAIELNNSGWIVVDIDDDQDGGSDR